MSSMNRFCCDLFMLTSPMFTGKGSQLSSFLKSNSGSVKSGRGPNFGLLLPSGCFVVLSGSVLLTPWDKISACTSDEGIGQKETLMLLPSRDMNGLIVPWAVFCFHNIGRKKCLAYPDVVGVSID